MNVNTWELNGIFHEFLGEGFSWWTVSNATLWRWDLCAAFRMASRHVRREYFSRSNQMSFYSGWYRGTCTGLCKFAQDSQPCAHTSHDGWRCWSHDDVASTSARVADEHKTVELRWQNVGSLQQKSWRCAVVIKDRWQHERTRLRADHVLDARLWHPVAHAPAQDQSN